MFDTVPTRPILFSAPMVRALRENRKTQTRRTRGLAEINAKPDAWEYLFLNAEDEHVFQRIGANENSTVFIRCPYGTAGDQLWTRECWIGTPGLPGSYSYRADAPVHSTGWRPSIHMPRSVSRDTLEVISVRPERLQAITEQDAVAEGIQMFGPASLTDCGSFAKLWESINGPGSWGKNPWVWVVTFRRLAEAAHA